MKEIRNNNTAESYKKISYALPAVELFSNPADAAAVWPEHIARDKEFLSQLESRRKLNERLDIVLSRLPRPDISLQEAVSKNFLMENQVADLYASLNSLLESGSDYRRIVLYLPFEFLPNTAWEPATEELRRAAVQFRTAFMSAWRSLLTTLDVRANFVDGDVLEDESRDGDHPRVVKAAHLIPKLVENGFLNIREALELLEKCDEETLGRSIADTLPVMADLGFLHPKDMARLRKSDDDYVRGKVGLVISQAKETRKGDAERKKITRPYIQRQLDDEFQSIDAEEYGKVTEKRKAWLQKDKKRKAIESAGDEISGAIAGGALSDADEAEFISAGTEYSSQQAFIDGIRKAIESAGHADVKRGQELYAKYQKTLLLLWDRNIPALRDALTKTFCRLHALGIVDDGQLETLGVKIPALAGPFSENIKTMEKEMGDIKKIIASMEKDAEISQYVYPVVLVYGSRLKGYGTEAADMDVAIFVKPGTFPADMKKMRASLKKIFTHEKIQGEITEFWLEKTENGLGVRDFGMSEPTTGDSSWTHVLFGAVWEGDAGTINELRTQVLAPYLYDDKEKMIHGRRARGVYIEELERDTLQYRLMHKGYEKFFPSYGGINTPHADLIDGKSIFWDSGYRQTATKLFASRVFLPKISK